MSIETLRDRILSHAPTHEYTLCLDPTLTKRITRLTDELGAQQDKPARRTIADRPRDLQAELDAAWQAARDADAVVVLRWRRPAPEEYQGYNDEAMAAATNEAGKIDTGRFLAGLQAMLRERSFTGAFTPDGEDLGLTWGEVDRNALSIGDRERITQELVDFNKAVASVPFTQASSGRSAQS